MTATVRPRPRSGSPDRPMGASTPGVTWAFIVAQLRDRLCENPRPAPSRRETLNKNTIIGLVIGLVVGLAVGAWIGSNLSSSPSAPVVAAPAGAPGAGGGMPGGMPGGGMPGGMGGGTPGGAAGGVDSAQQIAALQAQLAKDPKNVQAWTQLGNDYFDMNQPQKAIDAYQHALELQPKNPDVLTDQGVMYRAVGQYDKAVANFNKASELDPRHVQSLFNLGIVYAYDLKQTQKAIDAWSKVVQLQPNSPQAVQARAQIEQLRAAK
jgi:tetratricopeptide (TPR) repeat protein